MAFTAEIAKLEILFPAYAIIDRAGCIVACGPSLVHHLDTNPVGEPLKAFFKVRIRKSGGVRADISMRHVELTGHGAGRGLLLRGTVSRKGDRLVMYLNHAPVHVSGGENRRTLRFEDFSPSDSSIDMMMATRLQSVLMEEAQGLSRKLARETQLAQAASIAKTRFLATMSHEIRTPLNGMLGMAQILATRDLGSDEREMVDILLNSGEALLTILNDVLDFTRIEAGHTALRPTDGDFVATVKCIADLFRVSASEAGLTLDLAIDPDVPRLARLDLSQAGRCITNVVANAVKFTRSGGIAMHVSSQDTDAGHVFTVTVRDTGIGMTEAEQAVVFEPFTQVDDSTTREQDGSGLGLSICRRIMRLLGGEVRVESAIGEGSTFILTLPAERVEAQSEDLAEAA
ncbi:MAG: ATP-binding protein [Pseudomonadota bacterium]